MKRIRAVQRNDFDNDVLAKDDGGPADRRGHQRRVLMTRVGLHIPANAEFSEWQRAGERLSGLADAYTWCLGDWLIFGKAHYPDRYDQAIRAAGLKYQTLRNYAWIARRFDMDRRRSALTFQHHAEVASLTIEEQDCWLDRAEEEGWPSRSLRNEIRRAREGEDGQEAGTSSKRIELPDKRVHFWRRAADEAGVTFEDWVTTSLDRAAHRALGATDEFEFAPIDAAS